MLIDISEARARLYYYCQGILQLKRLSQYPDAAWMMRFDLYVAVDAAGRLRFDGPSADAANTQWS